MDFRELSYKYINTNRVKLTPGIKSIIKWRLRLPLCFFVKTSTAKWNHNTTYPKASSEGLGGALLAHLLAICGGHHLSPFHPFSSSSPSSYSSPPFSSIWFPTARVTGSITWCPRARIWSPSLDCAPSNQLVFCHVFSEIHQAATLLQIDNQSTITMKPLPNPFDVWKPVKTFDPSKNLKCTLRAFSHLCFADLSIQNTIGPSWFSHPWRNPTGDRSREWACPRLPSTPPQPPTPPRGRLLAHNYAAPRISTGLTWHVKRMQHSSWARDLGDSESQFEGQNKTQIAAESWHEICSRSASRAGYIGWGRSGR